MSFLNWITGTAGYTAILAAFGLAVAAHFFAPRAWSALAWTIAFGVLGAAFVGQREITSAAQIKAEQAEAREQKLIGDVATARADGLAAVTSWPPLASRPWANSIPISKRSCPMPNLKTPAFALLLVPALWSCASPAPVVQSAPVLCPRPPAPAAWAMQPSRLMPSFEKLFSITEKP